MKRFGNLIARSRRDALRIMGDDAPNTIYRLRLIGERLMAAFKEIDACTTLEERLMLIGANPADARDVEPGHDSMLYLLWAYSLEWSAMRRRDQWNDHDRAPLYWAVGYTMLESMSTPEMQPAVNNALNDVFGVTFEEQGGSSD
jgi:hypothetical protein